jgi:hypothetical protein
MGLDITAYSRLTHIGLHTKDPALNEGEPGGVDDCCYYVNHVNAFAYHDFPASFRGVPVLRSDDNFVHGGCYETTDETQRHRFQALSYRGYNQWRDDLRAQFNPDTDPDRPFYELIFFADNEGCIGPDAAKDLLADFRDHADRYNPAPSEDRRWQNLCREKYADWTKAFELAADGGLIRFH